MQKRIFSLLLAALLASSTVLAACSDSTDDQTTDDTTTAPSTTATDTTTEEPKLVANIPDVNMDGYLFNVYSSDSSGNCNNFPEEEIGEEINDAMYLRNQSLQEKYNFTLMIESGGETSNAVVSQALQTNALAGDASIQLYLCYTKTLVNYFSYLTPINNLTYVDYTMPWWYPDASASFNIDGIQFALSGCFDLAMPSKAQCLAFNKELVEEMNLSYTLYDLVNDGVWTLDKFAEIGTLGSRDLDGDGDMDENDRFGVDGHWKGYYSGLINGMGVRYATTDEQGYPVYKGSADETLINAIQTLKTMTVNNPNLYYNKGDKNWLYTGPEFEDGGTVFICSEIALISSQLRDLDFEIGVLPYPKADEEQESYYSQTAYGHSPAVPSSLPAEQYDNVGILMEAFAYNTYDELLPIYKEKTLKTKTASDRESSEMIDIVWDGVFYDFGVLCWEGVLADKIINELFLNGGDNIVSLLTTLEPTLLKETENIRSAVETIKAAE